MLVSWQQVLSHDCTCGLLSCAVLQHRRCSASPQLIFRNGDPTWCVRRHVCLHVQEGWFELTILRTDTVDSIEGELGRTIGQIMHKFFFAGAAHNLESAGLRIDLAGGGHVVIFLTLSMVIGDEGALHALYGCKGASGVRSCCLCRNVFNFAKGRRNPVEADSSGSSVHISCADDTKLQLHSTGTLKAVANRLDTVEATSNKTLLKEVETQLGWNRVAGGVMQNVALFTLFDPSLKACFDWMHVYMVSGIFNLEGGLLMLALKDYRFLPETVDRYMGVWAWPKRLFNKGHDAFSAKRAKASLEAGTLKVSASEGLNVYMVLAMFVSAILRDPATPASLKPHIECFLALAGVIGLLQATGRKLVGPQILRRAVLKHMGLFQQLYGREHTIPKHHVALHLWAFLQRWGCLLACFTGERKHRSVKTPAGRLIYFNVSGFLVGAEALAFRRCSAESF